MIKGLLVVVVTIIVIVFPLSLQGAQVAPRVEMAILLDTSGSMEGLLEQAKSQLWKIVNELALTKRDSKTIELYVALYEYGKNSLPQESGYMRMICQLTGDLDKISEELFILQTNGGDEYCGEVIRKSANELDWSKDNKDLKLIFIAGNEPFTQGDVDYRESCSLAISKGIIINTIFCGNYQEGINTFWKDGADLADGSYMNIDQNLQIYDIVAPQDDELMKLGIEINNTYLAFGLDGEEFKKRQQEQDSNALSISGGTMVERTISKSSPQYRNEAWDLVDASKEGSIDLEEIEEGSLPKEMKGMNPEERKEYIEELSRKREDLQNQINQLSEKRDKFITEERNKLKDSTQDTAIKKAIREQVQKKNYTFE